MIHRTCVHALLLLFLLASGCNAFDDDGYLPAHRINGEAMGTYYRVTYLGDALPGLQESVDSLFEAYNLELSPWVENSTINAFNRSDTGVSLTRTVHFLPNLELAARVVKETGGAYDPTVAPLVKFWGFGGAEHRTTGTVDTTELDSVRAQVGFPLIRFNDGFLHKSKPGVQLDLNASAKGYGVDLLSAMLTKRGRPDHLIDIGGEMRAGGTKNGNPWTVGIRLPDEDATKVAAAGTLPLEKGRAIATSGNYLNYYSVDGETYSHTINPLTGYVERNRLLSASVLADDCATADAFATACMVLGPEEALKLIEREKQLDGYFLVRGANDSLEIVVSSGLREVVE